MLRVMRLFASVAVALIVLFIALISFILTIAPDTSVLSYTVPAPDRTQAIWLMDVRTGLSYFTGAMTRPSNYSAWSPDGNIISTVDYFGNETRLNITDLTTDAQQSLPVIGMSGLPEWSPDITKIMYYSATREGSLRLIDAATGEETIVLEGMELSGARWLQDSASLVLYTPAVSHPSISESAPPRIHRLDLTTGALTTIVESYDGRFFNITESPQQIVYILNNQLMITPIDAPDEARTLTILEEPTVYSFYLRPPDQQQIVLTIANEGVQEVWLVDINTGERELVNEYRTANPGIPVVRWSSDGELIARITEATSTSSTLEIIRAGQLEQEIITNQQIVSFTWSPDNRYLLAYLGTQRIEGYLLINVSTGSVRELADDILPGLGWQPQSE